MLIPSVNMNGLEIQNKLSASGAMLSIAASWEQAVLI
jgi:hypothetical protein